MIEGAGNNMEKKFEKTNLSNVGIYSLLGVKNPKKFHLTESRKKIITSIELLGAAKRDLLTTPFYKHKKANMAIVAQIERELNNAIWYLLNLGEALAKFETIKQSAGSLTDDALNSLLDELQNPEAII